METRTANLIIGTSGGTAGGNATNFKLALPSTWIKEMGLTPEQRQVELRFDGASIVITRKLPFAEFLEASRHAERKTLLLSCYSGDALCEAGAHECRTFPCARAVRHRLRSVRPVLA